MQTYVFIAMPFNIEIAMPASNYYEAERKAWEVLTKEQQDNCEYLDYVDNYDTGEFRSSDKT